MNHPFPEQLPLLRRIYADRFTFVRFLIPFARLPDRDVITVYRGSYSHAGYLNDARHELTKLDCDFYIVLHDDVLLNPKLSESNFASLFPLQEDEAFIPKVGPMAHNIGDWSWYFGMLPKLLFPKSHLFGSGIEWDNLLKYLPPPIVLERAMQASNIVGSTKVKFDPNLMSDVARYPSRSLFKGLGGHLDLDSPAQARFDEQSYGIAQNLVRTMLEFQYHYAPKTVDWESGTITLPIPLVASGFNTDFYILPKAGFETFCHYIGVASAANLFVEIMAPTLLFAAASRVRNAAEFGLDFSGFEHTRNLDWFFAPAAIAMHPVKLSMFSDPAKADVLIEQLQALAHGSRNLEFEFMETLLATPGWHMREGWGRWAATHDVLLPIAMPEPGAVELVLRAPLSENFSEMKLEIRQPGADAQVLQFRFADTDRSVTLEHVIPDQDGIARIQLVVDRLMCPAKHVPGALDTRQLGIGVLQVQLIAAS